MSGPPESIQTDAEAARAVLSERAMEYVAKLEDECEELRTSKRQLEERLEQLADELVMERDSRDTLEKAIRRSHETFEDGITGGLQEEAERSIALMKAVKAALVNMATTNSMASIPVTSQAAARRVLEEGLQRWHQAGGSRPRNDGRSVGP